MKTVCLVYELVGMIAATQQRERKHSREHRATRVRPDLAGRLCVRLWWVRVEVSGVL